ERQLKRLHHKRRKSPVFWKHHPTALADGQRYQWFERRLARRHPLRCWMRTAPVCDAFAYAANHAHAHSNGYSDSHANTHRDGNSERATDAYSVAHSYTQSDTQAAPDSAPSPDSALKH